MNFSQLQDSFAEEHFQTTSSTKQDTVLWRTHIQ